MLTRYPLEPPKPDTTPSPISPPPAPPPVPAPPASDALAIWQEKLDYLRQQEAIIAYPAQKFSMKKQIEEAQQKIAELGGKP